MDYTELNKTVKGGGGGAQTEISKETNKSF